MNGYLWGWTTSITFHSTNDRLKGNDKYCKINHNQQIVFVDFQKHFQNIEQNKNKYNSLLSWDTVQVNDLFSTFFVSIYKRESDNFI